MFVKHTRAHTLARGKGGMYDECPMRSRVHHHISYVLKFHQCDGRFLSLQRWPNKLTLGCVIWPMQQEAESRNLGHTSWAISVLYPSESTGWGCRLSHMKWNYWPNPVGTIGTVVKRRNWIIRRVLFPFAGYWTLWGRIPWRRPLEK